MYKVDNFAVLASLLILAALCVAQDANQNPEDMSVSMQDANLESAPVESNEMAIPEDEANDVILPSEPARKLLRVPL